MNLPERLVHYITASIASTFNKPAPHTVYTYGENMFLILSVYYPKNNKYNITDIRKQWIQL